MRDQLAEVITEYKDGREIKQETKQLFTAIKSVTRSEFYTAYSAGQSPKLIFEFDPFDFASCDVVIDTLSGKKKYHPSIIRFDDEEFIILRTYIKDSSSIEVTVR